MREQIDLLWSYVRGMWRFRWYALGVAWLVAAVGWTMSLQIPDEYEASAQVHVDTESMLQPLMRGLVVQQNVERRVELMTRTLLSRPNLEQIARATDLDLQADSPQAMERIIDDLERRLRLSGTGRDNLYRIRYQGTDRELSRDVVQACVDLLVEETMGRARADSDSATRFLDRKIEEYAARMEAAEQRRIEFRREHAAALAAGGGDYYQRLQQRMLELEEARADLELAQSRERELESQLEGEVPVFGIMSESEAVAQVETPELDRRIREAEDQLDELLLRYTEEHPRVGRLRTRLEHLEHEREQERERLAEQRAGSPQRETMDEPLAQNPVHQEIRAALARTRAEIAAAETRVEQHEVQVEELRGRVDEIPEIEAAFQQLTRDYESIKQTHDELVSRRQTAEISGEVDRSEDQVEFRVVEPPRVPSEPVAPNRPLLVTASLGAAGAGYGAMALLLALVWPTFYTRGSLNHALQLPVLGAIEQVWTPAARRRWWIEMGLYALAVTGLLIAYGVVLALALAFF